MIVAVLGAGTMGAGIAQLAAASGADTLVYDPDKDALARGIASIEQRLAREAEKGRLAAGRRGALEAAEDLEELIVADVVIEAAPEKLPLKQDIFAELDKIAPRRALIASNTSVIPITRIAARVEHRDRVLGTHWWVPPYLVPLVEVIETEKTAPASIATMMELLTSVGKEAVHVRKDVPGFIGNRLQHALWREAIALVQAGVCDAPTIDKVVKASFGRRLAVIGPLESADLVGTDLALDCHVELLADLDRTPGPLPYLRDLVASGRLGFKTGEGFRKWTPAEQAELRAKLTAHLKKMAAELDRPKQGG